MSDLIDRQKALELVRDVCDAIWSCCDSHYDTDTGDEVYDDIKEVDAILKCNKEIRIAIRNLPSAQPESTRTFVELVVTYPDTELCTYKEFKGKPYYSIKYIENGETYVGYGTYKPEVLSQYLREYFMPSTQPEPQWIPVTKKAHPDLPIRVQVQMDNGWIITAYYQEGEWLSVPDCGEPLQDNWIEAWRELPEPYTERREE